MSSKKPKILKVFMIVKGDSFIEPGLHQSGREGDAMIMVLDSCWVCVSE